MATNYPNSLDSLTNPTPTSTTTSPSHSSQHTDENDAIEAIEARLGVGTQTSPGAANLVYRSTGATTSQWAAADLSTDVTGNLGTSHLASGSGASSSTYWRGDGAWATPAVSAHNLLSATHGDTVTNSVSRGSLIYGNASPVWDELVIGSANRLLKSNGTDVAWAQADLTTDVTGIAPVANGGTGISTAPSNGMIPIGNGTNYTAATLTAGTGVTVTNTAGAITVAAPIRLGFSTIFETAGRFTPLTTGSATATFGVNGLELATTASSGSVMRVATEKMGLTGSNGAAIFALDPAYSCVAEVFTASTSSGICFLGLGAAAISGASLVFSAAEMGFKIVYSGGTGTLYATCSGGTETATSVQSFVGTSAQLSRANFLTAVKSGSTSIKYYVNGVLAATHTTNLPSSGATVSTGFIQHAISNESTAAAFTVYVHAVDVSYAVTT